MKKKICIAILIISLAVIIAWMLVTGFSYRTDVYIGEYSVSEDGSEITFSAGIATSMGYIRGFKDEKQDNAHYLKFYSAWGGLNSSLGAKSQYVLKLNPEDKEIYVYGWNNEYRLVLQKNESGEWIRVKS